MEVDAPERKPELERVITRAIAAALQEDFFKILPAAVVRYDAAKQQVDCQPLISRVAVGESDERIVTQRAVVPACPLMFPGGGGYRLTFPISDGATPQANGQVLPATTGVLLYADASIDRWLAGGGQAVDPEIDHAHAPSDGIFIPGLRPFGAPLESCPGDHATLGADGGVQVHLRADTITVGDESGSDFVALAQKVLDQLTALKSAINGWIPQPNDGGNALKTALTALFATWPASVAATQAKAK
jgi:hypothetical protein